MLTKKSFPTLDGATRRENVVIPAARVAEHDDSRTLLDHAREQAAELLTQARSQARQEARLAAEQAEADFWRQADALLQTVRHDQDNLEQLWVTQSAQLLREALSQLLEEVPPSRRREALLRQLLKQRQDETRSTLHCHPEQLDEIKRWLEAHPHLDWRLVGDASLAKDALTLNGAYGVMSLNWRLAASRLMPPAAV